MTKDELINKLKKIQSSIKTDSTIQDIKIRYNMINGFCNQNFIKDNDQKVVPYIKELTNKANDNFKKCQEELEQYINELINAISNSEES